MIPKVIHYIWLGKKAKPKSFNIAYQSWLSNAPGYKIQEWNEDNIKGFALPHIFLLLLKNKKFAFASDVLRFFILNKHGGVYMDVDQVLTAGIDDLLNNSMFIARYHQVNDYYGFGILGCVPGHAFTKDMIDFYGSFNKNGFVVVNKIGSELINRNRYEMHILSQDYFYPIAELCNVTENTRGYHLANTSWIPWYKKLLYKIPNYLKLKSITLKFLPNSLKKKMFKIEYL